ncbi:MAG: nascent polypeptide-associated complex protein [Desulfurococcaceae archaeon]
MVLPMGPRDLRRALKRLGIEVEELKDVEKVEITLKDKVIVVENPQVLTFRAQGTTVFQVAGTPKEVQRAIAQVEPRINVSEEDVEFVMKEAGVSREEALKALVESGGDIALALLKLKGS